MEEEGEGMSVKGLGQSKEEDREGRSERESVDVSC